MTFKDILLKINTFPADLQADARRAVLQGKLSGMSPAAVWDSIKDFEQVKPDHEKKTTKQKTVKASAPAPDRVPEVIQGETVSDDDYINGLYLPDIYNKINQCIDDFCLENEIDGIQGLKKSRQSTWAALCTYIGVKVFKRSKILKSDKMFNNGSATLTTCGAYDIDKIVAILKYCDYLCQKYDKVFTFWSACDFCGVDEAFISDHADKLTSAGFHVFKKTENSINNSILDGRTNPTGAIATLNYRFKWAQPSQTSAPASVNVSVYPVLSASDAPALPDSDKM